MLLGPCLSVPGPGVVKSVDQVGGATPEKDHHAAVDVERERGVRARRRRARVEQGRRAPQGGPRGRSARPLRAPAATPTPPPRPPPPRNRDPSPPPTPH